MVTCSRQLLSVRLVWLVSGRLPLILLTLLQEDYPSLFPLGCNTQGLVVQTSRHGWGSHQIISQRCIELAIEKCISCFLAQLGMSMCYFKCFLQSSDEVADVLDLPLYGVTKFLCCQRTASWIKSGSERFNSYRVAHFFSREQEIPFL